ncbi:hypothetical protein CEUSTIGMA_g5514.t1 [Chlamydomonas eustigma]|uniref:6-pyruvoyltetrahydropterin synthase n=1 Tax=Chlamydomonas eustigma TaxID=1157962 RepID=A0A250X5A9_9CHLO|nr:hypothetical protein CEUSTIGMA_g5514.t1 [Chlamydomonas eustigma]|eukprot:GAX78072.1 hypothetical protein CEUSTIGMA_g5514.t1 [Chlamydomonas eustigma]
MAPYTPSLIVVSGASRGFGLACAVEVSKSFPECELHLLASTVDRLSAAKATVAKHCGKVVCHGIDLSKLSAGDTSGCSDLVAALSRLEAGTKVLFVHSAAVLGPLNAVETHGLDQIQLISQAAQVNVVGTIALSSLISSSLKTGLQDLSCVNISSKAAVNPGAFDLFDVYSITKSAAHFTFASLSKRGARVLQYCPGPMKTDMTSEQHGLDWPWVEPSVSASAMVSLIKENDYENNACLDFLDDNLLHRAMAPQKVASSTTPDVAQPLTPPRADSPQIVLPTSSEQQSHQAGQVAVAPLRRKCMITRIEAFSSSHTLENCSWCEEKNKQVFGKCNNLHGHNYKVEFSFSGFIDQETGMVVNLTDLKVILQDFLGRLDHSHLNDHVDIFNHAPTTAEVISQVLFEKVSEQVKVRNLPTELVRVKVWETEKNIAEYPF